MTHDTETLIAIGLCALLRARSLRNLWIAPQVRRSSVAALVIAELAIAIVVAWLLGMRPLLAEQVIATFVGELVSWLIRVHFAVRAAEAAGAVGPAGSTVRRAGLAPRALARVSNERVELVLGVATLIAVVLTAVRQPPHALFQIVWLVYLQLGLLLFNAVLVWTVSLDDPEATDDVLRWRRAWTEYQVRAVTVARAFLILLQLTTLLVGNPWAPGVPRTVGLLLILTSLALLRRARARLKIQAPAPRAPSAFTRLLRSRIVDGSYVMSARLVAARGHPGLLVRGRSGLALNVANPGLYAWLAYGAGFIALILVHFAS